MIDLNQKIIDEIKAVAEKYPIQRIVLFGSRARGDNNSSSDIDLAVFIAPNFKSKGSFSADIDDLNTLLKIDIVFMDRESEPNLLENIKKEGVVIYEQC